jgi:pimeloyl-ACP methyl ester carboxylesterase
MKEQARFFARNGAQLFAFEHLPAGTPSGTAFVMSHPFGEEKLWSHRTYVSFARALAARGHLVMRFDYLGAGDSTGALTETSLATHLADLAAACAEVRARHPEIRRVGLIGLRLGATFAALLADNDADQPGAIDGPLVLWDPILDGDAYFQELLRSNLSTQLAVYGKVVETREVLQEKIRAGTAVNVDGYELARPLFESCAVPTLLAAGPKNYRGPVLVVQIAANDKIKDRDDLAQLAGGYAKGTLARAIEQPFWREIKPFYGRAESLQAVTLEWLEKSNG